MRAIAILMVLPLASSLVLTPALEDELIKRDDERLAAERLRAGRDVHRFRQTKVDQEKLNQEADQDAQGEWGIFGFGDSGDKKKHHKHVERSALHSHYDENLEAAKEKSIEEGGDSDQATLLSNAIKEEVKEIKAKHGKKHGHRRHHRKQMDFVDDAEMQAEKVLQTTEVKVDPSVAPFRPRMEIIASDFTVGKDSNIEVFWQRPEGEVKGVMFGATGCFHMGGDFFEQYHKDGWEFKECKDSKLRRCQGLPDTVYFFKYARQRGYLVLTITPQGKNSCWDHEEDPKRVNEALRYVLKKEQLPKDTPMFASGASQGGYFMYDMQEWGVPNLKCIAPQCAEIQHRTGKEHLPTMMIYMPKDNEIRGQVEGSIDYLRHRLNGKIAVRTPHPWAVHELMAARGYSAEKINATKYALQKAKGPFGHKPMSRNGYIIDHPGTDGYWIGALKKFNVFNHKEDSLKKDHSQMHQLMQVAWAEHEFTAEYTDHIIDFCESGGQYDPKDQPLRHGRSINGGSQVFNLKASGVHGAIEESIDPDFKTVWPTEDAEVDPVVAQEQAKEQASLLNLFKQSTTPLSEEGQFGPWDDADLEVQEPEVSEVKEM